jgi:uncharacterized RDD family membrane protein YckC
MYCSKCGNAVPPNSTFCQVCGNAAAQVATAASLAATPAVSPGAVSPHWLPPVSRPYAGFWLRLVAHLIDRFLCGAIFLAICLPLALLSGLATNIQSMARNDHPDPALIASFVTSILLIVGLAVFASWLYNAYFESSDWQATVGKKVMNIIVTDLNGNRISFGRASGRFFAKLLSDLIPLGIGYILAGVTEKKQALHDMIASCLVLRT